MERIKRVNSTLELCAHDLGLGIVKGKFEGLQCDGKILDTNVELEVTNFSITWNDREKLMEEIVEVIKKYQI